MRMGFALVFSLGLLMVSACATSHRQVVEFSSGNLHKYTFDQLDSLVDDSARPIAIFLHTDWCTYCASMQHTTLRDEQVMEMLNGHYYFVSFDAEQRTQIDFRGRRFTYRPNGRSSGTHELATALGTVNKVLTYPTIVILNTDFDIVFQHNAFVDASQMLHILEEGLKQSKLL